MSEKGKSTMQWLNSEKNVKDLINCSCALSRKYFGIMKKGTFNPETKGANIVLIRMYSISHE